MQRRARGEGDVSAHYDCVYNLGPVRLMFAMKLAAAIYPLILAIYLLLALPILSAVRHQRERIRGVAGSPQAKARFLRSSLFRQTLNIFLFCALWLFDGIPAASLGLGAPSSWWLAGGLAMAAFGFFVVTAVLQRGKAAEIQTIVEERASALIPNSTEERRLWAGLSIAGGVFEELAYRGFLFYYLRVVIPHIDMLEIVVMSSALFGLAHIYQGWRGVASTGVAGLIMGGLYALSGNLVAPIVAHIMANLRLLLILPREKAV